MFLLTMYALTIDLYHSLCTTVQEHVIMIHLNTFQLGVIHFGASRLHLYTINLIIG